MANNYQAFERLLSSIPKFDAIDPKINGSRVSDYYKALERHSQSDMFIEPDLVSRLSKIAKTQSEYDLLYLKIKHVGKLVDELYDLKYQ